VPVLNSYPRHEVPDSIAMQIASYVRIQWPFIHGQSGQLWDRSPSPLRAVCFVLMEGEALVSHAQANFREIEFAGQKLVCGGLSTVFTYPDWRGTGLAKEVVRAGTEHIRENGADLAMLFCGERLRNFYTLCGWEAMDSAKIYYGDPAAPKLKDDNLVMMLFVSEVGKRLRERLGTEPVFVGPVTW
jgi:GNAT superfamily N-acetyltransferase